MVSKDSWERFFRPGSSVIALPSWARAHLYVPADSARQRWTGSALYSAFRPGARACRGLLRLKALLGVGSIHVTSADTWMLADFVGDLLPAVADVVVKPGTPGPTQSIVVQVRDEECVPTGYLKYAESPAALDGQRRESVLLNLLPRGTGPEPLKQEAFGRGSALLLSPLHGRHPAPYLPIRIDLDTFFDKLVMADPVALGDHPRIQWLGSRAGFDIASLIAPLSSRKWQVVIQHGDLAPWNLLCSHHAPLAALDWEQGVAEGFPYLDLAYYVLQVAALMHRWKPGRAARYAEGVMAERGFDDKTGRALVRLAALDAFLRWGEAGAGEDTTLQAFRRAVFEEANQ